MNQLFFCRLQSLEAVIEAHEAEQREAEAAFTVGLVQQLQHIATVLQSDKAQAVLQIKKFSGDC